MRVSQLIAELQQCDQNAYIIDKSGNVPKIYSTGNYITISSTAPVGHTADGNLVFKSDTCEWAFIAPATSEVMWASEFTYSEAYITKVNL